jgi:2-polyprenyl-6-methoxyphenol hydroxylase-like FAD-dependent oxidoreductase
LAFLPLAGPQGHTVAVVWSVPHARAQALQAMSPEDFCQQLTQASEGCLGKIQLSSERATWPLQMAITEQWAGLHQGKAWALAGDAAHTLHPLAGQGLNLGLADAAVLADTLQNREYWRAVGDEKLLRRYARARKADVVVMGAAMDGLQKLFSQTGAPWKNLRNWGMSGFERSGPLKQWVAKQAMGFK